MNTSPEIPPKEIRKPNFFLVRHGESITNVSKELHNHISDPAVWLTERGQEQARMAGQHLAGYFRALPEDERPKKLRIMRSNYKRAIQTAENIETALRFAKLGIDIEVRDVGRLRELEFGYTGQTSAQSPHVKWLSDLLRHDGYKFYAKRYGGESPADVDTRARLAIGAMYRDQAKHDVHDFIVVNHGLTMRVLIAILMGYGNDWYEKEPNPDNCAIRHIENGTDKGFVFPHDNGQWDPSYTEKPEDYAKLNQHGRFFSAEEKAFLIATQVNQPDIMTKIAKLMKKDPQLRASDAIARLTGLQESLAS